MSRTRSIPTNKSASSRSRSAGTRSSSNKSQSQAGSRSQSRPRTKPYTKEQLHHHNSHRFLGFLAALFAIAALICTAARALPADLQALPYVPVAIAATPWFALLGLIALLMAIMSRKVLAALIAVAAVGINGYWQYPFFHSPDPLPQAAYNAVAASEANTADAFARVMTFNVYKGQADAQTIVDTVRDQRVEVLALQETTDDFVQRLKEAGIERYLPYSNVSSSDGVYGNGLWSATPLSQPVDDEVNSSASFMPAGTVDMGGNQIRFVSVHTTAPVPGYWRQWKRSIDELGLMRGHTDTRYVFMGDFNATYDHAPFREFLGSRFLDATRISGHGFTFSWPTNRPGLPMFAGIDHVVLDQGMRAGQCKTVRITGSDHAALLVTIDVMQ
ncbi:endonuclease/exonuclease/phosphatase family protein [Bifidobacterium reuteri]|uniref:Endonuclease/exonuclease/phosphatase family protein n=1 Tax=Bifidobacterium reuteri TaxID=983706 RepID=A0A5J5E1Y3_9BIFI|nr:endonuclease/exonuclease/phosphatase family protein [Bifidobacterium reuteri]KAA8823131.1 endonuclease/exonuclease/phosphatase family protein [Bifidobacterium reuteri]